jgi:hypothetical protein
MLGAAVVLMPVAVMEIADNTVCAPWYLMLATFWALLWRPRTRTGMAAAALVAFAAASSEINCVLFAPLVAARLFVLRRPREHAVTAGWLAGCLVQVPAVLSSFHSGLSRGPTGSLDHSLAFYAHEVVLPAPGWHLAWWLQSFAGKNGATAIVAVLLVAAVGAILVTQPSNRPVVVTALLTGFAFCLFDTTVNGYVASLPLWTFGHEPGSRYSVLPIFLIQAVVIVGIDYLVRRRGGLRRRPGKASLLPAIAVFALVAVLSGSWVADFRDAAFRSYGDRNWGPIAAKWQYDCAHSRSGAISENIRNSPQTLPCAHIRP